MSTSTRKKRRKLSTPVRKKGRKLINPARNKGRKQSHPYILMEAHYKILCKKMNWPKFWPIWASMSNLIAHSTPIPKKGHRSTLLIIKVHPRKCVTRRKKKRITLLMIRVYLGRRVSKRRKKSNIFLVRIHPKNCMMKKR